jgi:flagellar biosynthesis/type III secretory pathway chaperone
VREACKKVSSITINVKDTYLDQFKIICLINNNKKNEAQLMHDLLREQKLSNKFFDNKISFLLDLKKEEDKTIDDSSLLNFYLSSITVSDFNYMPNKKTDKKIWKYLISSNLLKVDDFESKNEIKKLEIIANNNNLAKSYIFEIYTNLKFNFNDFLNIDEAYLTLDSVSARALIYQKILLSDNVEAKLKYLFLLNDLFKKDNLTNIFKEYLSQELQALDFEKIPLGYKNLVFQNITEKKEKILGKIKYNDSKYYTSKITKFYTEKNNSKNKIQKELEKIHNKIKRNKKYKIFIQDAILFESLENDGFKIPKGINFNEIKKNNLPPIELLNLVKNKEVGLVLLRIIELVGEDEILDLDLQTIYFINYLFNEAGFTRTRNKILFTILPERSEI